MARLVEFSWFTTGFDGLYIKRIARDSSRKKEALRFEDLEERKKTIKEWKRASNEERQKKKLR
jgi:hypothetical protein